MDFQRRVSGLQEEMAQRGVELAAYGPSPDFQYLTGLALDWRAEADASGPAANVFVPRAGAPVLVLAEPSADLTGQTWIRDVRVHEEGADLGALIQGVLRELGAKGGSIALGGRVSPCVTERLRSAADAEPREAKGLMDRLRMIKDPEEIERLRSVARLTDRVLEAVVPRIREGVTQPELEAEVELRGRQLGAAGVSFPPAVIFTKSGSEPAPEPFVYPRDKGLVPGTSIAFDIGFVKDGYCSDFGRSLYFGEAREHIREGYAALQQSLLETVDKMHDSSMRMRDLFPALERTLDRLGYGDTLRARLPDGVLGHCIGVDVHENPWINPHCDQALRANMVMALEPKLWHSGEYYLRVEDMVLVGENRSEILTHFSRETFQVRGPAAPRRGSPGG